MLLKRIVKRAVSVAVCISLGFGLHMQMTAPKTTAVFRVPSYAGELILDEGIPLGLIEDTSVCMTALRLINDYRLANGLDALMWNKELDAAAAVRADEARTCWSHTRPNGQPWHSVNPSIMYGENLGKGYDDADSLVRAWQDSPTHNENLLYSDFHYAAIARVGDCYALEFA